MQDQQHWLIVLVQEHNVPDLQLQVMSAEQAKPRLGV